MKALVKRFEHEPFTFLGIHEREGDPREIAARLKSEDITWRNGLDLGDARDGKLWSAWAVRRFQQFYLLGANGVIRKRWFGDPGPGTLEREIDASLAERAAGRASGGR